MKTALSLLTALLLHASVNAQATYEQSFNGHLELHNQVEYHTIPIYSGRGNLRVWTDSYTSAASFDPVITLWHNGARVAMSDDNQTVNPLYQHPRDAGLVLSALPLGTYVVTITAYPNFPLNNRIGGGFVYDAQTPVPIRAWCPPGAPGPVCRTDRHFSLHWTVQ